MNNTITIAVADDHPILLNGLRWSLSGLVMFYFFPFPKKHIKQMLIISFVGCTVQYSLSFYGLKIIDGASATLFVQSEIPFGILIAFLILGEKPPLKNIIGLIIAFIGIFILSGNPNLEDMPSSFELNYIEAILLQFTDNIKLRIRCFTIFRTNDDLWMSTPRNYCIFNA